MFIIYILINFPDKVFPVLDLLRLGALNPSFAQSFNENFDMTAALSTRFITKDVPINQMLYLRLLSNTFGPVTNDLAKNMSSLISQLLNNMVKSKTNEVAASTLVLNYSIAVSDKNNAALSTVETQTEVLMAAVTMLEVVEDGEAVFRTLVAVGNIISGNSLMIDLFRSLSGNDVAERFISSGSLPKIQQCASQIKQCV